MNQIKIICDTKIVLEMVYVFECVCRFLYRIIKEGQMHDTALYNNVAVYNSNISRKLLERLIF